MHISGDGLAPGGREERSGSARIEASGVDIVAEGAAVPSIADFVLEIIQSAEHDHGSGFKERAAYRAGRAGAVRTDLIQIATGREEIATIASLAETLHQYPVWNRGALENTELGG